MKSKGELDEAMSCWRKAFELRPELGVRLRFSAACSLIQEGSQKGKDGPAEALRGRCREQGRSWLEADLGLYKALLDKARDEELRDTVKQQLQRWLKSDDLLGVREPKALEKLPVKEKEVWQQLWRDVDSLLDRVK